ncbi:MAG TPA: hypothetical protein VJU61_08150 [Polyangiaceae bacterium]|nr:hypothetical protein [Polyangiaceae bacterium]
MTTFQRQPKADPEAAPAPKLTAEEWENQAANGDKPAPEPELDPNAPPTRATNLRLNEYELRELERGAKREDTSMQRLLRRIVRNYIKHHRYARLVP